jgi:hypothetical protein
MRPEAALRLPLATLCRRYAARRSLQHQQGFMKLAPVPGPACLLNQNSFFNGVAIGVQL